VFDQCGGLAQACNPHLIDQTGRQPVGYSLSRRFVPGTAEHYNRTPKRLSQAWYQFDPLRLEPVFLRPGGEWTDNQITCVQALRLDQISGVLLIRFAERDLHLEGLCGQAQLLCEIVILRADTLRLATTFDHPRHQPLTAFPGTQANALFCPRQPGQETTLQKALGIDNQIEFAPAKLLPKTAHFLPQH